MTTFINDLKAYLITQNLMSSTDTTEYYDEATTTNLICLAQYDSSPELGRISVQFLCRDTVLGNCISKLNAIYSHFFDIHQPEPLYKVINGTKCKFKPLTTATSLKKVGSVYYYVMNVEIWKQKL